MFLREHDIRVEAMPYIHACFMFHIRQSIKCSVYQLSCVTKYRLELSIKCSVSQLSFVTKYSLKIRTFY